MHYNFLVLTVQKVLCIYPVYQLRVTASLFHMRIFVTLFTLQHDYILPLVGLDLMTEGVHLVPVGQMLGESTDIILIIGFAGTGVLHAFSTLLLYIKFRLHFQTIINNYLYI